MRRGFGLADRQTIKRGLPAISRRAEFFSIAVVQSGPFNIAPVVSNFPDAAEF